MHSNKINNLDGLFSFLKNVETLSIYDNELRNLDSILEGLGGLTSLTVLDLFDNPAAHEPNYKLRVLNDLRSLQIHDKHKVSAERCHKVHECFEGKQEKAPAVRLVSR